MVALSFLMMINKMEICDIHVNAIDNILLLFNKARAFDPQHVACVYTSARAAQLSSAN